MLYTHKRFASLPMEVPKPLTMLLSALRVTFEMSVRTPSSARVLAAHPCAIPGGELGLAQLAPTLRQGANTNQNTNVAGGDKTGRELSRAEAVAGAGLTVAALDSQGKFPRKV